MIDFMTVATRRPKKGLVEVYPKFIIKRSDDLMIRGRDFYAVWVEDRKLWSTDEQDALMLIDRELSAYVDNHKEELGDEEFIYIRHMWDAESGMIDAWHKYCQKQMRDHYTMLDEKLIFSNMATTKKDFASKRLSYPLEAGEAPSYTKLITTLYSDEERHKIEWAIGSIVAGESKNLQKFMVLYGSAGTGKSTILNIIQQLFDGYYSVFSSKALGSANDSFALESFRTNPLVSIEHDGDLSRIEDNTRLNSLVSHEEMMVNEKFKAAYSNRFKSFLFMGTNKPVRITDAKSGLIRRLIDVHPSGRLLTLEEYERAISKIRFELGAIAYHCKEVYLQNPNAYDSYVPIDMIGATNDFYNFIANSFHIFKTDDCATLKAAWEMYKAYCDDAKVSYPYPQRAFKEELKNYFSEFYDRYTSEDGKTIRNYFKGFLAEKFDISSEKNPGEDISKNVSILTFDKTTSIFDSECASFPAQYASEKETPKKKWDDVKTVLSEIDTSRLHYVKVPENHIVIDFDIPGPDGKKCFERNLIEASKWPPTYAELSKSGAGIHLHYIYTGDPSKLSRIFDENIEVKIFTGNSSLRRKLTKCNGLPIATISSGLPLKGDAIMINFEGLKNEKALRTLIKRNLQKEYHAFTKPSIDFIYKALEDAYNSGMKYDVTNMRNAILAFAASSTHQSEYCINVVNRMHFKSDDISQNSENDEAPIVFYDVEVFPNLFLVNWKVAGEGKPVIRMINPTQTEIEELLRYRLIGFNCRRYDNHMLYARLLGYDNEQLYSLSQKIIEGSKNSFFGEAYNVSYTDVYDFAAKKQSLKKWEIELGIHHKELGLPWDQPVPEDKWAAVAEYCDNDVLATEEVFNHLRGDWTARQILADLSGMTVNDTTNSLTTRIIFGTNRNPNLVYTDLATGEASDPNFQRIDICNAFPGYEFVNGKNMYRGDDLGKGGYVYAEPGMYFNVALLDIASMHPTSAISMNIFGEYTKRFEDLLNTRILVKHKDYESAKKLFDGKLARYLDDPSTAKDLAQALKIAINSVYGLTSANFENPFRDIRNQNNIVALRGALFMRTLQDEVKARGFTVAHIKTDSIKIPNATPDIIQFCMEFAQKYGYTFEHEATYERMCLVNDAVYIAKYQDGHWSATGTQFQVPYVFKTLFSKEPITFDDLCETKSVTSALYLDMNEGLGDVSQYEKEFETLSRIDEKSLTNEQLSRLEELSKKVESGHRYIFIGKVGRFCPILPGGNGGILCREAKDTRTGEKKYVSAGGAKGYRWKESETVLELGQEDLIDRSYYDRLVDEAVETLSKYGDFYQFVADDISEVAPWFNPSEPWNDEIESTAFDVR